MSAFKPKSLSLYCELRYLNLKALNCQVQCVFNSDVFHRYIFQSPISTKTLIAFERQQPSNSISCSINATKSAKPFRLHRGFHHSNISKLTNSFNHRQPLHSPKSSINFPPLSTIPPASKWKSINKSPFCPFPLHSFHFSRKVSPTKTEREFPFLFPFILSRKVKLTRKFPRKPIDSK